MRDGEEKRTMRVELIKCQREYNGFFKLDSVVLRHEKFDGTMSKDLQRLVFERGDSAAVLLYDSQSDEVVLVEQFRYPAYVREGGDGRLLEVVAGVVDRDRTPEAVARAELVEEAGYAVDQLEHLATFYASPGACTERIHLYLGYLKRSSCVGQGGGLVEHGEDIRVHRMALHEACSLIEQGLIRDAKTIMALQYLLLRRGEA
jgi:ADP-ribose pyrophosphatase